jgi:hypothetical protein
MADPLPPNDDPFLHRILRDLPDPKSPASLAPAVLARLRVRAAIPWWRLPILQWPLAARITGFAVLAALVIGFGYALGWIPNFEEDAGGVLAPEGPLAPWQVAWSGFHAFRTSLATSASLVPLTVWWTVGASILTAYLGCLGFVTLLYRRIIADRAS